MANHKRVLYDFFAALFILSAPYLIFVDHQNFRFEYLNVLVLACFALIAGAGAALLRLISLPAAARVVFFSFLLMQERGSITARGTPDAILALAFEHHLAIGKNIPLDEVICWLTSLAPTGVIEFVQKSDPTVQRMLAIREDIFDEYTEERFRATLESCADITDEERITDDNRVLIAYRTRSQG